MVVGEWVAGRLRASMASTLQASTRLTRKWVEQNVLGDLSYGGGGARGLGSGGAREVVARVFLDGGGFPKPLNYEPPPNHGNGVGHSIGVAEVVKKRAMDRLREMVDTSGDSDRIITGKRLLGRCKSCC
jgi:chromosome transmission fidelity protein 18